MRFHSSRSLAHIVALLFLFLFFLTGIVPIEAGLSPPQRIVSTSPSITEILFALGLGPRVVGVSVYCEYPPQVRKLPKVGTFLRPDPEKIVRLQPDLVIVHRLPNGLTDRLSALHIPFAEVDHGGLEDSLAEIREIGEAAGAADEAKQLISNLRTRFGRIHAQTTGLQKPTVLFVIGREPGTLANLIVVGRDGFLNDLIETAGGANLMAKNSARPYPHVSIETVLRLNPEVLIDMGDMGAPASDREKNAIETRALWQGVSRLKAVKNDRVYCLTSTVFVVPGPRSAQAAEMLFFILHGRKPQ